LDEIWQADAEWHADDEANVKIITGSRIQTWHKFVSLFSETGSSNISAVD